jgi:hypothetical protein
MVVVIVVQQRHPEARSDVRHRALAWHDQAQVCHVCNPFAQTVGRYSLCAVEQGQNVQEL